MKTAADKTRIGSMNSPTRTSTNHRVIIRRYRPLHWFLTAIYGLLLVASLPLALMTLKLSPAEGVSEGLFFAMTLAIAAVPFTIAVCLTASWMYYKGGAHRAAFVPYAIPLFNIAVALILRAMLVPPMG
ncbi:hypothetical protein EOI86_21710 [Hwanghaeella grinnelliae]|uniref:Uncharacterized protein n=1 Tax=Hwanghaeella grinnelliae TaxID=2500179 RepID=A0A3S2Z5U3_9PROT|nr:hypothetical protein [Hwanghaeella grinnelliae]RVU33764.1 hypothetical protein EOI86_21710 [Hwanghaeella grinnelliae]